MGNQAQCVHDMELGQLPQYIEKLGCLNISAINQFNFPKNLKDKLPTK